MTDNETFEIYVVATPGLEAPLLAEARDAGFSAEPAEGGIRFQGGWPDVWRANLTLRGGTRVLARIGSFRALHLAQLDKRARKFPWSDVLRPDVAVRVEATCRRSRIYHAGAASQRIARAIHEELGAPLVSGADTQADAGGSISVKARIEDDLCTISLDTSGQSLHKRGFKQAVAKAPMRETMAAMFLHECGYRGTEPVLDPMCGSGTFVIEAAEIAMGLHPGRTRDFAFQQLATFDPLVWQALKDGTSPRGTALRFHGCDRDSGAIRMSAQNAQMAGVAARAEFRNLDIADLHPPEGPPGLVIVNPPYGARIGNKKPLYALYATLGRVMQERFAGWRVGLITSDGGLARATNLPFLPPGPYVAHGGLKVRLYRTAPL